MGNVQEINKNGFDSSKETCDDVKEADVASITATNNIKEWKHLLETTNNSKILENTITTIANTASQSQTMRNNMIHNGIFDALLRLTADSKYRSFALLALSKVIYYNGIGTSKDYKKTNKTPSDLCEWNEIKHIIPMLIDLLKKDDDKCHAVCLDIIHNTQCYMKFSPKSSYICDIFDTKLIDTIISLMEISNDLILSST